MSRYRLPKLFELGADKKQKKMIFIYFTTIDKQVLLFIKISHVIDRK